MAYTSIYMNVPPLFTAIRAISIEFAQRIYVPVVCIAASVLVVVTGLLIWFVTMSGWWWLLLAPVIMISIVFIFVAVISGVILKYLNPAQTKEQRRLVKDFVDTIQKTSEAVQLPKFVILFRLIKDVISPGKSSYVRELSSNASSLKTGLGQIVASFSSK